MTLTGVIVMEDASGSIAVVKNEANGKTAILKQGEILHGYRLICVFENKIALQRGDKTVLILLGQTKVLNRGDDLEQQALGDLNIQAAASDGERQVEPGEAGQPKSPTEKLLREIQNTYFIPNFVNGDIEGFRIINLPKGGLLSEGGIVENDIVREINGIPLGKSSSFPEFFDVLKTAGELKVLLIRDGKPVLIQFKKTDHNFSPRLDLKQKLR